MVNLVGGCVEEAMLRGVDILTSAQTEVVCGLFAEESRLHDCLKLARRQRSGLLMTEVC